MELLLAFDRLSGAPGDFEDGSGSGSRGASAGWNEVGRGNRDASKSGLGSDDTVGRFGEGVDSELLRSNDSGSLGDYGLGEGVSGVNLRTGDGGNVFSEIAEKGCGTGEVTLGM